MKLSVFFARSPRLLQGLCEKTIAFRQRSKARMKRLGWLKACPEGRETPTFWFNPKDFELVLVFWLIFQSSGVAEDQNSVTASKAFKGAGWTHTVWLGSDCESFFHFSSSSFLLPFLSDTLHHFNWLIFKLSYLRQRISTKPWKETKFFTFLQKVEYIYIYFNLWHWYMNLENFKGLIFILATFVHKTSEDHFLFIFPWLPGFSQIWNTTAWLGTCTFFLNTQNFPSLVGTQISAFCTTEAKTKNKVIKQHLQGWITMCCYSPSISLSVQTSNGVIATPETKWLSRYHMCKCSKLKQELQ